MRIISTFISFFYLTLSYAQCPQASITASQDEYCISDFVSIRLANAPIGSIISWNAGNGWDTAGANYSIAPSSIGQMDVSARFTTSNGTLCTVDSIDLVYINDLPAPTFSISKTKLCEGEETVILTDETPDTKNRTWIVNGNRFVIKEESWNIKIQKQGYSSISLIVEDSKGCRNTTTKNNALQMYENIKLGIEKSNQDNCVPVNTSFSSSFTSTTQTISSYAWQLPGSNKTSASTKNVSNVKYANIGNNNVSLTVTTNRGCEYKILKGRFITVGDTATLYPIASKSEICLSEPVTLTQTNQPLPGTFNWDIASESRKQASKYEGEYTFRDTGYFDLVLTYNHNNCISQVTSKKIVRVGGQKAIFSSTNYFHCEAPHTVDLLNTSDTTSGIINSYYWLITDSETGTIHSTSSNKQLSVEITESPSTYDVMLVTTSNTGCTDTVLAKDFISVAPYQFDFSASPQVGCIDQEIRYTNKTKSSSYYGLDLFSWDFLNQDKTITLGASSASIAKFKYSETGYFHTKLTAANPLGCQQINTLDSAVKIVKPSLNVLPKDSIICAIDFTQFKGNSTPVESQYSSYYFFKHKDSGKEYDYYGDSVLVSLLEIGDYELRYRYGTATACKDTLIRNIYANGIKGSIALDTTNGCNPLQVRPTFEIEQNSHIGSDDSTLSFSWEISPKTGARILGASSHSPIIELTQPNTYRVSLFVTNSTGCSYSTISTPISIGIIGEITSQTDKICLGDSIVLTNKTANDPSTSVWNILSTKNHSLIKLDELTRSFTPLDTGKYLIRLAVGKDGTCTDTAYKTIDVTSLKADFALRDSNLGCAPVTAEFINNSLGADSLYWDFGNSQTINIKNQDTTKFEYNFNSPDSGFTVQLIAKSNFGCLDTIQKIGLVKLNGPLADFEIMNGEGCEPNVVQFINNSKGYDSLFLAYGDGLRVDTNIINGYTYFNNTNNIQKLESPSLLIKDGKGCTATLEISDGVSTYKYADAKLNIDSSTIYCQRQLITIEDTGKNANTWTWTLNDVKVSTKQIDIISLSEDGLNKLKLIASNQGNCSDTATRTFDTKETPSIYFLFPEIVCKDQSILIVASTDSLVTPIAYRWNLGEPNTPGNLQTTTTSDVLISYRTSGVKVLNLEIDLDNGCTVYDSSNLSVFDSEIIRKLEMNYVQYTEDNKIEAIFNVVDHNYFEKLNLYRNNELVKEETIQPLSRVVDSNFDPELKNCYNLSISDKCGVEGEKGRTHCPVFMDISLNGARKVKLDWTYYVGWDRVEGYVIYRQYPDSIFKALDTVFNTQKSYVDSMNVCDVTYNYKIVALKAGSNITSQSNIVSITPEIDRNTSILLFDNISVPDNEHIELRWSPSTYKFNDQYMITKHASSRSNIVDSIYVGNITEYTDDDNLTPELFHYYYKLHQVDNCDHITETDKDVKTILLTGSNEGSKSELTWTKYEDWSFPIKEHHVEHISRTGKNYVNKLNPNIYSFTDANFYDDIGGYYYYQIHTVNTNGDTSYSNIAPITGDGEIYKPTAFTPNGDGLNDQFRFTTLFITNEIINGDADFEIAIFNRWGQKIFQSNNLDESWNGTSMGEDAPTGVYQYRVMFTDGKGKKYHDNGIIQLLR